MYLPYFFLLSPPTKQCTGDVKTFFPLRHPSFSLTGSAPTYSLSTPLLSPNRNCTHYDVTSSLFCRGAKEKKADSNYSICILFVNKGTSDFISNTLMKPYQRGRDSTEVEQRLRNLFCLLCRRPKFEPRSR